VRTLLLAAPALLFAILAGCEDPPSPKLCLLTAADLGGSDPLAVACPDPPPVISLTTGEAYYIRHELPQGVQPPGPLHLRIDTVCGTAELLDVDYGMLQDAGSMGPVVVVPRVAPPAAECSVTVNATIANSALSVATRPVDGASCVCPVVDAGAGDAGDGG
jgi:hypothetical protein